MPSRADARRIPTMEPPPTQTDDPYRALIVAMVHRAVEDAQGHVVHPGNRTPGQVQCEAQSWLTDGRELAAWLELAGFDPASVVERVRWMFPASGPAHRGLKGGRDG
jgi:hypothetical protein